MSALVLLAEHNAWANARLFETYAAVPEARLEEDLAEYQPVMGILQPLTHPHKHRSDVSMLLPRLGGAGIEMDLIEHLDELRGEGAGG